MAIKLTRCTVADVVDAKNLIVASQSKDIPTAAML